MSVDLYNVNIHSQRTLSPFCNVLQDVGPPVRTCSVDRDLFAECSLIEFPPGDVPSDFQVPVGGVLYIIILNNYLSN